MSLKAGQKISDRELRAMLASLREDVAAPRDFRARVLDQISVETGRAPGRRARAWHAMPLQLFRFFSRPVMLPLAAALCLAAGAWLALRPQGGAPTAAPMMNAPAPVIAQAPAGVIVQPPADVIAQAPAPVGAGHALPKRAVAPPAAVAQAPAPDGHVDANATAAQPSSAAPATTLSQNSSSGLPLVSSGGMNASASQASLGAAHQDKPIIIVVTPSPTPLAKPLPLGAHSQVRGNKLVLSRGGYASVLFKLKAPGKVRIEISDRMGKLVSVLKEGDYPAGIFEARWHGHDDQGGLASTGIYQVRVKGPDFDERHKVVLIK